MDPLSKGTLVVATSFFDMKFKYHMVYHFLFKCARGAHIIIFHTYNTKFNTWTSGGLSVDWLEVTGAAGRLTLLASLLVI